MTNGRLVTIHLLNASFSAAHSCARTPVRTLIPALPQQLDSAAGVFRIHVDRAHDHVLDSRGYQSFGAGRRPPGVEQGSKVT